MIAQNLPSGIRNRLSGNPSENGISSVRTVCSVLRKRSLPIKNSEGKIIQPNAKPGDVKFVDYNDDGVITDADRQHCGSTIPKFQLGMNLGFEYNNFDLQFN